MSNILDPDKVQAKINAATTCDAVDDFVSFITDMVNDTIDKLTAQKNKLLLLVASSVPAVFIANLITHLTDTINEIIQTITDLTTLVSNLTTWAGLRKAILGC